MDEKYYSYNKDLLTISIRADEIEEDVKVPLHFHEYTITEIQNIEDLKHKLVLSDFLKNKYSGKNIEFIKTFTPCHIGRAFLLYGRENGQSEFSEAVAFSKMQKWRSLPFQEACHEVKIEILLQELEFLKENLRLDKDQIKTCEEEIYSLNGDDGVLMADVAWLDIKENVLKEKLSELKQVYKNRSIQEFRLYLFSLYEKSNIWSKEYWINTISDYYVYAKRFCSEEV